MNIPDFADGDLLNEGWSISLGDTAIADLATSAINAAQRRPERQPRRHNRLIVTGSAVVVPPVPLNEGRSVSPGDTMQFPADALDRIHQYRSTKAGASAPATPFTGDEDPLSFARPS